MPYGQPPVPGQPPGYPPSPPAYSPPNLGGPGQPGQPPAKGGKGPLIAIIIGAAVVLIGVVVAVLFFTGVLGGKDETKATGTTASPTPKATKTEAPPTTDTPETPTSEPTPTQQPTPTSNANVDDFCRVGETFDVIDENDTAAMEDFFFRLAAAAPSEIKDDMTYLAEAFQKVNSVDESDLEGMMQLLAEIDMERMLRIAEDLPIKIEQICGL